MKTFIPKLFVTCLIVGVVTPRADGGVIYNNFGVGDAYNIGAGDTISIGAPLNADHDSAVPFTTPNGSPQTLLSIEAAVGLVEGVNDLNLWLMSDVAGAPGVILETFNLNNQMGPFGSNNAPLLANSTGTLLQPNTQYWVAATMIGPNAWAGWNRNTTGDGGLITRRTNLGPWNALIVADRPTLRVTLTPEPSTYILIATTALCIAVYTRRRKRMMAV